MSEMIERVAMAIRGACDPHVADSMCEVAARAAIEAMREPTEAMLTCAERAVGDLQNFGPHEARVALTAMIDEALK
jgi:hypothetical protein